MSFRGLLRPGQGFKRFDVMRPRGGLTATGRPRAASMERVGEIFGIVSQTSATEVDQWKQKGHPVTHTLIQRGAHETARAMDVLRLEEPGEKPRLFMVRVTPKDAGKLGHFTVYKVEERRDLQ